MAKNKKLLISCFLFVFFCAQGARVTHAALIAVTPVQATVTEGATFTVSVRVDTEGKSVNAAETHIVYPTDSLSVVSATPGTTFTLQTPGSVNSTSTGVFFSAGIPSGYTGINGVLGKITFKALKTGSATITVKDGKALLNDGNGTDAFRSGVASTITIIAPKTQVPSSPTPVSTEPYEPIPEPVLPVVSPSPVPTSPVIATIAFSVHDLFVIIIVLSALIIVLIFLVIYLLLTEKRRVQKIIQAQRVSISTKPKTKLDKK